MTYLAPAAADDTVLIENYVADALPLVGVLPIASDTVQADGVGAPTPAVLVVQPVTDTVLVDGVAAATPIVIALPVPTDTVVAEFDFAPVASGEDASSAALTALEAQITGLDSAVDSVRAELASLTASLGASFSDVRGAITAASAAAIAQAEAASAAAVKALQDDFDANRAAVAQAATDSAAAADAARAAVAANQAAVAQAGSDAANALAQVAAVATTITSMQSAIGANASSLTTQAATLATLGRSLAGQITAIQAAFDSNKASVSSSLGTLTTAQSAIAAAQTALASTVAGNAAAASQGLTTEATARQAVADSVTSLKTSTDASFAGATGSISTLTTQQLATAASLSTLQSAVSGNAASASQALATEVSARQALAGSLTSFQAAYDQKVASYDSSISALSTAQGATATQVANLTASLGTTNATAASNVTAAANATGAVSARVDSFTTSFNQSLATANASISTLTSQQMASAASLSSLQSALGTTNATATQNAATAASATQAVSGALTSYQATVSQQFASFSSTISTLQTAQQSTSTAVQTLSATVAGPAGGGNDIPNSELNGTDGWTCQYTVSGTNPGINFGGYSAPGTVNVLFLSLPGTPPVSNYADWYSPPLSTSPGARYEMSVLAAYHRAAYAQIFLEWLDATGAHISFSYEIAGSSATGGTVGGAAGGILSNFSQIGCFATAPANAASRRLILRVVTNGTEAGPFGFFTHPMTRIASAGQAQLSTYSPGTQANVPAITSAISNNATAAANATSAVATQLNSLTATYNQQLASFNTQFTALNTAQGATATNVSTLSTTVNGHTATLGTYGASIDGLKAQYVLSVGNGERAGSIAILGAQQAGGGSFTTEIDLVADTIRIKGNLIFAGGAYGSIGQGSRTNLTSALTLYVRLDGNDANSGLTNTPGGAFQTLTAAWRVANALFTVTGQTIILQLGTPGTYAGVNLNATGFQGSIYIVGDATGLSGNSAPNQSQYVITAGPPNGLFAPYCVYSSVFLAFLVGVTVDCSGLVANLDVGYAVTAGVGEVIFQNSTLKCTSNSQNMLGLWAAQGGLIGFLGTNTFTGGGTIAGILVAQYGGQIFGSFTAAGATFNVANLGWRCGFAWALDQGGISVLGLTIGSVSGASGPRFQADNASIDVFGQGLNFFPGSSGGFTQNNGIYKQ